MNKKLRSSLKDQLLELGQKIKEHDDGFANGMMRFVEETLKDGLKSEMEGLEDGGKPPKLLMIHVLNNEQPMEQVKEQNHKNELETDPTASRRSCTYRP